MVSRIVEDEVQKKKKKKTVSPPNTQRLEAQDRECLCKQKEPILKPQAQISFFSLTAPISSEPEGRLPRTHTQQSLFSDLINLNLSESTEKKKKSSLDTFELEDLVWA